MSKRVKLPIWVVIPRAHKSPSTLEPREEPHQVLAFTEIGAMTAFLQKRRWHDWNLRLVQCDFDLLMLVADLHASGIQVICLDPVSAGGGGTAVRLDELARQIDANSLQTGSETRQTSHKRDFA